MKKYYVLESSCYVDYGLTHSPKLGSESVLRGHSINSANLPPLIFEHNFPKGEVIPGLLEDDVVLASQQFIDTLQSVRVDNFEIYPATLINPETKEERKDYFLFNVIGLMSVVDMNSSEYDTLMVGNSEGIEVPLLAFDKIVIDEAKTNDMPMFRLAEDPGTLIISEQIVDALKSNKPPGGWGVTLEKVEVS